MTRVALLAVLALAACDRVFDLEGRDPVIPDAPTDAQVAGVVSLDVPAAVATDETVTVTARVTGIAGSTVTCAFSTNRGSFNGGDVVVTLDANGDGIASAEYTAPGTVGSATLRAAVDASSMSAMLDVLPPIVIGHDSTFGNGNNPVDARKLFGNRFNLNDPLVLRQVGVWMSPVNGPTMARIGIYDASRNLIAATEPVLVVGDRNVFPLTSPQPLPAGQIWIITVFDRATVIYGQGGTALESYLGTSSVPFTDPMPAVMPTGSTPSIRYSTFLVAIN